MLLFVSTPMHAFISCLSTSYRYCYFVLCLLYLLKTYLLHCDFILAVPMRECPGGHWCMSSTFPIASLNGTCFFRQCNCKMCIRFHVSNIIVFYNILYYSSRHYFYQFYYFLYIDYCECFIS